MITHTIYVGVNLLNKPPTLHMVDEKDCLPPDITQYEEMRSTASKSVPADMSERFFKAYELARFAENYMGFHVLVDIGRHSYETGQEIEFA